MARKKAGTPSKPSMADHKKWQALDDLRTLERATEIRMNAPRLKAAKAAAKREMANLKSIAGSPEKKAAPKRRAAAKPKTRARKRG